MGTSWSWQLQCQEKIFQPWRLKTIKCKISGRLSTASIVQSTGKARFRLWQHPWRTSNYSIICLPNWVDRQWKGRRLVWEACHAFWKCSVCPGFLWLRASYTLDFLCITKAVSARAVGVELGTKPGLSRHSWYHGRHAAGNHGLPVRLAATRVMAQQLIFRIRKKEGPGDQTLGWGANSPPTALRTSAPRAGSLSRRVRRKAHWAVGRDGFYYCGWRSRLPWRPAARMQTRRALARPWNA